MMEREAPRIDEFPHVILERTDMVPEIMIAAGRAERAARRARNAGNLRSTDVVHAIQKVNGMLMSAAARCGQNPPPPTDIEMTTDPDGYLIYRCQHATPHKWKLDGTPI
ncbi:hypothetical protein [Mesorhizobium ciceri]|uniref:hypothetical protein n=1 Tax=Mesorhizobium TaxID=68287 RepID=UPI00047E87A7|nr:hypothetical protein [Mesorhizobium ciceri]